MKVITNLTPNKILPINNGGEGLYESDTDIIVIGEKIDIPDATMLGLSVVKVQKYIMDESEYSFDVKDDRRYAIAPFDDDYYTVIGERADLKSLEISNEVPKGSIGVLIPKTSISR